MNISSDDENHILCLFHGCRDYHFRLRFYQNTSLGESSGSIGWPSIPSPAIHCPICLVGILSQPLMPGYNLTSNSWDSAWSTLDSGCDEPVIGTPVVSKEWSLLLNLTIPLRKNLIQEWKRGFINSNEPQIIAMLSSNTVQICVKELLSMYRVRTVQNYQNNDILRLWR